jgi:hypothetical protein
MADTKHHAGHAGTSAPVEGDGIHYAGIVWFVVILTATTIFCMVLVWGVFRWMDAGAAARDAQRSAVGGTATTSRIIDGRIAVVPNDAPGAGTRRLEPMRPGPDILVVEPSVLQAFRANEETVLTTYGWVSADRVRIPIDRAKDLLLEHGLPVR